MERLRQDLKYALRLLSKNKAFTLTAVVTLAVCIAANAAVFSIVNAVVLRPLPFDGAGRLVYLFNSYPKAGVERASTAVPDYYDRLRDVKTLETQAIYRTEGMTIGSAGNTERIPGLRATPSMFAVLRVHPVRGRTFTAAEGEPGQERKVVLSYGTWQKRFAGRDDVIGRTLRIDGVQFDVVGVLGSDFRFISDSDEPQIIVPAAFTPRDKSDDSRHNNNWQMIGRLKTGATLEQLQVQLNTINARNLDRFPQYREIIVNTGFSTKAVMLQDDLVREVRTTLYLLWAGALFVLLIGGVNVANLVLVRATARLKELATRHVLGASPGRLARQMLTETTLLTFAGAAVGLLLGYWALRAIAGIGLEQLPRAAEVRMDLAAVAFTFVIAAAMGLFLGVVPIVSIRKSSLSQAFKEEGRSTAGGRRARVMRVVFVTAQVAIALVLLVGAGLLFASFRRVLAVDPGFTAARVMTGKVALPNSAYKDDVARRTFASRALDRIRALPGVSAAAVAGSLPFTDSFNESVIFAEGYAMRPGESLIAPLNLVASDGYFEAMGIALRRGRYFDRRDSETSTAVVIVDERLARKFWPNTDPVGKRMFRVENPADMLHPPPDTRYMTVVGVVREARYFGLTPVAGVEATGACYFPASQQPLRNLYFAVSTRQDPSSVVPDVRRAVAAIDPEMPLYDVKTMQDRMDRSLGNRRTPMLLALAFACVALLLATVGVYGVLAYQVTQRTREIGIRMALGGAVMAIFKLVFRDGLTMVGLGLLIGLGGAFAMSRSLQSQLYGIGSMDPLVISAVALLLGVVALVACVVPALRATRVNPVKALMDL